MKKTLFILLLLIINLNTKAQDYLPMAVENAQWTIFVSDDDALPPFNEYFYGYRIQGDTIINSLTYKKVYRRDFAPVNPDLGNPLIGPFVAVNETLFGAIRDDIINKKVYGIRFCPQASCVSCDQEFLMYDFQLNINDSYDSFCLFVDFGFYVGDITQEIILNDNRKVQHVYDISGDTFLRIYEGVGGKYGPFEALGIPLGCPCTNLSNYCIGNDQKCLEGFILSTNEQIFKTNFKIYPNPVKNNLNIESISINNSEVQIFNILGKLMLKKSRFNTNSINVSALEKGIYILKYYNQTHKFIKQ